MDLNYTNEQLKIKDMARKFAENEIWQRMVVAANLLKGLR